MDPAARIAWTECCIAMRLHLPVGSYSRRMLHWGRAQDYAHSVFMNAVRQGISPADAAGQAFWTAKDFLDDPTGDASA